MSRIAPLEPPYASDAGAVLAAMMPPGVPPIALFRLFARNVPMTRAMHSWGRYQLGRDLTLTMRQREIVIDRTCARCGCVSEWGVHVAFFAGRVGLTPEQVRASARGASDDAAWSEEERLLIRLVDELHDGAQISDPLWTALAAAFSVEQVFESIALVGFYHTVSYFANGLRLPLEPFSAPFPTA
jgi:alkylhydroperoxidase family enzyme